MGGGGGRGQSRVSPQAGVKAEHPGFGKLGRRCRGSPDTESILVANRRGAPTLLQAWLGAPCLQAGVGVAASGVGRIDQMYLLAGKLSLVWGYFLAGVWGESGCFVTRNRNIALKYSQPTYPILGSSTNRVGSDPGTLSS